MASTENPLNCPLREAAAGLLAHAGTRTFVAARGAEMEALRAALEPADAAPAPEPAAIRVIARGPDLFVPRPAKAGGAAPDEEGANEVPPAVEIETAETEQTE